jgi:hypothetical protein
VGLALALILAGLPIQSKRDTSVNWFEFTMQSPGQVGTGTNIAPGHFCTPSDAIGAGTLSFTWWTLSGNKVILFDAGQTYPVLPPSYPWLYLDPNASFGGYSISTSLPFNCGYATLFAVNSTGVETVYVSGTFTYNYTTEVPLL